MDINNVFMLDSLVVLVAACAVFLSLIPVAIVLAKRLNLLDYPVGRKQHSAATPLVGGIAVYVAFAIVALVSAQSVVNESMLFWFSLVLMTGVADDYFDLSQKFRLVVHSLIVIGIALTDGHLVLSIGSILGGNSMVTFILPVAVLFTAIAVIGAINAVNMIDGVDGLLGSLAIISLVALLVIGSSSGVGQQAVLSLTEITALIGALVGFLIFNSRFLGFKKAKVFMGDAGSTVIGFVLVYLMIGFSQGDDAFISPVAAGWLLGLPLLDASAVIAMRIMGGKSPISPGRDHLHHILLRRVGNTNKVVAVMAVLHTLMVSVGVFGTSLLGDSADMVLFWLFVSLLPVRCLIALQIDPEMALQRDMLSTKLRARFRKVLQTD